MSLSVISLTLIILIDCKEDPILINMALKDKSMSLEKAEFCLMPRFTLN